MSIQQEVRGRNRTVRKYIKIMRLDHWIKQLFILPGLVAAMLLTGTPFSLELVARLCAGFFATCFIASANYVINEWLDAEFDKYHPTKKYRSVVSEGVNGRIVWLLWGCLSVLGFALSLMVNVPFLFMSIWLWLMGLLYNVKPIRTKDVPVLDVLSESVNNAIRLLMGWFIASGSTIPPSSLLLGYWMAGAFLMATKRFAEYRMITGMETSAIRAMARLCARRIIMIPKARNLRNRKSICFLTDSKWLRMNMKPWKRRRGRS